MFNFDVFYVLQTEGSSSVRRMYTQNDLSVLTTFLHIIPLTVWLQKKKLFNTKRVSILSIAFVWNISDSTKNTARYDQTHISVIMWNTCYFCHF